MKERQLKCEIIDDWRFYEFLHYVQYRSIIIVTEHPDKFHDVCLQKVAVELRSLCARTTVVSCSIIQRAFCSGPGSVPAQPTPADANQRQLKRQLNANAAVTNVGLMSTNAGQWQLMAR